MLVKKLFKKATHFFLGDYHFYKIFYLDLNTISEFNSKADYEFSPLTDPNELEESDCTQIQNMTGYAHNGSFGYVARINNKIIAVTYAWSPELYRKQRNFWPLKSSEVKIVQSVTHKDYRSKGVGSQLINFAVSDLKKKGFQKVFGRIWHNHTVSIKMIKKSGWSYAGLIIEIFPFNRERSFRFYREMKHS